MCWGATAASGATPTGGNRVGRTAAGSGQSAGVKAYSHVSDRFSPFATQTIPATVHEAPYILDGLLMNETGRRVREQLRRHGGLHRPCLRSVLDPRVRVRPTHPGPAFETALRVRTRRRPEAPAPSGRRTAVEQVELRTRSIWCRLQLSRRTHSTQPGRLYHYPDEKIVEHALL